MTERAITKLLKQDKGTSNTISRTKKSRVPRLPVLSKNNLCRITREEVFDLWIEHPEGREADFKDPKWVATELGMTTEAVCQAFREGRLIGAKIGGRIKIHWPHTLEYLRNQNRD